MVIEVNRRCTFVDDLKNARNVPFLPENKITAIVNVV